MSVIHLDKWCRLPTNHGCFRLYATEHVRTQLAMFGNMDEIHANPLVRVQSSCANSELFGALDCDCADQLSDSMAIIAQAGNGILIHLNQEGRGQGLVVKIAAQQLMEKEGIDTYEAFRRLGLDPDIREYSEVRAILKQLNITSIQLITNNPAKADAIRELGVNVTKVVPIPVRVREENHSYLCSKARHGHAIHVSDLEST